jgi:hypothetical protein
MNQGQSELLRENARGAKLIFNSAQALYNEAQVMGLRGTFARALFLHQICLGSAGLS